MALMERKLEVIRGWPNDGSLDNYETYTSGQSHTNGSVVIPTTSGAVTNLSVTGRGDTTALGTYGGVVFAGAGDSASCAASGKDVVIWGNAIVKIDSTLGNDGWTPAIGDKVTYRGRAATGSTQTGLVLCFDKAAAGDMVVGYVKNVEAAGTGVTSASAALTIVLN